MNGLLCWQFGTRYRLRSHAEGRLASSAFSKVMACDLTACKGYRYYFGGVLTKRAVACANIDNGVVLDLTYLEQS